MQKINIGICGGGTVGGGVIEILQQKKAFFQSQGIDLIIKKLCVRDANKTRDFTLPDSTEVVTDYQLIVDDPEIDLVVEVIGGTGLAKDIVFEALKNGKEVVTANKALIADNLEPLETLLTKHPERHFGFEAAVAGGIPIISTLQNSLKTDNITQISGILNGTTNFILSKMEAEGLDYQPVLKEAQDLGFAEADPSADVDGFDARAKIAILTKLALGVNTDETDIYTSGISQISKWDFEYAKLLNSHIKLLAVMQINGDKTYSCFVSPVLVPKENPVSQISGATNVVEIESNFCQKSFLVGEGAGRFPTANSLVADIWNIANARLPKAFTASSDSCSHIHDFTSKFYVRFTIKDGIGIIKRLGELCEKNNISIDSILQLPIEDPKALPFVLITEKAKLSQVQEMKAEFEKESFCVGEGMVMVV